MSSDIFESIVELRRRGGRAVLATIVARKGSTPRRDAAKMLVYEDGRQVGTIGGGCTEAEVCREAPAILRSERPVLLRFDLTETDATESGLLCGGLMEVYVEPILPDPTLFIFGAGHVGSSVAEVARIAGFRVEVADDRVKYCNAERFPGADALHVADWETVFRELVLTEAALVVIATRGHNYDLACLRFALTTPARYIGLLGSRRKTKLLYDALQAEGVDPAEFERVFSPVGLDVAAETPQEIAVSIVAELVAVRKHVDVRSLRGALRTARSAEPAASRESLLRPVPE